MHHFELHQRLDDLGIAVLSAPSTANADLEAVSAFASAGCSACARALVNARDLTVDLAMTAPPTPPSSALRERLLQKARERATPSQRPDAGISEAESNRRSLDPASAVAHLHLGGVGERERIAEIAALDAMEPGEGDETPRVLAEIERVVDFPILFVSIVDGERVGYRVQRGLPPGLAVFRELRREMSYCTHCVSADAPLVVENASREPFFRASKMVTRFHVNAYAGVPLRTSRGIAIGTVCALDFRPRKIAPSVLSVLRHYAEPVLAEIEAIRDPSFKASLRVDVGNGARIYRTDWFERLVELAKESAHGAALIAAPGDCAARVAESAEPGEIVGRRRDGSVGLLLAGPARARAERRCADLAAMGAPARIAAS